MGRLKAGRAATSPGPTAPFFARRACEQPCLCNLLPAQMVAGAGTVQAVAETFSGQLSLNNAGGIGFQARRPGDNSYSVFTWEKGTITPALLLGANAPGAGRLLSSVGG